MGSSDHHQIDGRERLTFHVVSGDVTRAGSACRCADARDDPALHVTEYRESTPQLQLSLTDACNMTCEYCSFRDRVRADGKPVNMPRETASLAIQMFAGQVRERGDARARVDFGLAGEPMARRQLHDGLIDEIERELGRAGVMTVWAGPNVTNATLMQSEELVAELGPPQDISIDGPEEVHDRLRRYNNGTGTYKDVRSVLERVLAREPGFGVSAVLTALHTDFRGIFLHLHAELGARNIYMKPVNLRPRVKWGLNADTLPAFIDGYRGLVELFMESPPALAHRYISSLNPEDYFARFFYRVKDRTAQVYRCGAGKSGAYVDTNGRLYPCAHFIGKSGWHIGDLETGFDEERVARFAALTVDSREPCRSCWARYLCGGGCHYQAVLANGDPGQPDAVKCDLVRFLSAQAIRLVAHLATHAPEVLLALPAPYALPRESLAAAPEDPYGPVGSVGARGTTQVELARPAHATRGLCPDGARITLTGAREGAELVLRLAWGGARPRAVSLELVEDPASVTYENVAADNVSTVSVRAGVGEPALQAVSIERGVVRRVPFRALEWQPAEAVEAEWEPGAATLRIRLGSAGLGFNLAVELGGCDLVLSRLEPFVLLDPLTPEGRLQWDVPMLQAPGGEYLNALVPDGLEPVGRWGGRQANVC
jgi:radical SAM protein with 4Fe4S-binding SPASM domain